MTPLEQLQNDLTTARAQIAQQKDLISHLLSPAVDSDLMRRAITTWGRNAQFDMAVEEAAELIVAIRHYQRGRDTEQDHLCAEVADMKIMVAQLEMMVDRSKVWNAIEAKQKRLKTRLDQHIFNDPEETHETRH